MIAKVIVVVLTGRPLAVLACLAVLLGGCAAGVDEFRAYSDAYDLQHAEAQAVLDKLASDEREIWRLEYDTARTPRFAAENARYYVQVGDPPLTGSIRDTLEAVRAFNGALVALAEGDRSAVLAARANALSGHLSQARAGFGDVAAVAAGSAALSGFAPLAATAAGRLNSAAPLVGAALAPAGRAEFRALLLEAYPILRELLVELRPTSEAIYNVYLAQNLSTGASREEQLADRELVAGWVILLDETITAMDAAVAAAADGGSAARLARLDGATLDLRVLAETLRARRQ